MARDMLGAYQRAHLMKRFQATTTFGISSRRQFEASFEEIAGRLARDTFLSDVTTLDSRPEQLAREYPIVIVFALVCI
ncbi:hypothetical protein PybrP1_000392 [[Pythium] brassicae (nom. inval.)]|nr:hypothetical protein PybrP1_000392 [[Pythium] brassicae (nom. inval.)]